MELLNQFLLSGHQSVSLHAKESSPVVLDTNPSFQLQSCFWCFLTFLHLLHNLKTCFYL